LYALVTQGKALSTDFSFDPLPAASVGSAHGAFLKGHDSVQLIAEIRSVLSGFKRNGVAADKVAAAKRHEILKMELEKSSAWNLAVTWSRAVAIERRSSPEDDLEAILRVTAADVDRVAREYLDLDRAVVATLTPRSSPTGVPARPVGRPES